MKYIQLLSLLLGSTAAAYGQSTPIVQVPQPPTTSALERYALMPVSEAAGTPSVSIPLYEVRCGALKMPLSLSYHASGIKVADQASWVGLGWSLNAGGVITRLVRGLPDDDPSAFPQRATQVPVAQNVSVASHGALLQRVSENLEDFQPDLYAFNVNGLAGTFVQRNTDPASFCTLPLQPVHIAPLDTGFVLTDAQGTSYRFQIPEYSYRTGHMAAGYMAAWYLDRIVSADKADTISFEYQAHTITTTTLSQQQTFLAGIVTGEPDFNAINRELGFRETSTTTRQTTRKLRRIRFRGGQIDLISAADRLDVQGERRLMTVHVTSTQRADTVLRVQLYQSYADQRLRLDSVRTGASAQRLPPYVFRYNKTPLPDQQTGSRDHWGYANGAPRALDSGYPYTVHLIPATRVQTSTGLYDFPGADREPNPAFVQAGLLTRITYPTGGYQSLVYEPNTVPERYALPNPQVQVRAVATGPSGDPDSPPCTDGRTTHLVSGPVVTARVELRATRQSAPSNAPTHQTTAVFTLRDLTTSRTILSEQANFASGAAWSLSTTSFLLDQGHQYELRVSACGYANGSAVLTYETGPTQYAWRNQVVGGVRIRELRLQATATAQPTIRRYYYNTPATALSSGYKLLRRQFVYARFREKWVKPVTCGGGGECPVYPPPLPAIYTLTTLSSSSLVDATSSQRVVGYNYVTAVDSAAGGRAGRTVSRYQGALDAGGGWYPPVPTVANGWQRDQLLSQEVYATPAQQAEHLVSRTLHEYAQLDSLTVLGFTAARNADITYDPYNTGPGANQPPFVWENTFQRSGWQYQTRTRQYRYGGPDTSAYHLTTTCYRYDNPKHQQPTLVETRVSDGAYRQTRYRFAADCDTTSVGTAGSPAHEAAVAVRELLRQHMVAFPLEQVTTLRTSRDTLVTAGTLTLPRRLAPGVVVAARQLTYRTPAPQPWRRFSASSIRQGMLRYDPLYQPELIYDRYNASARLLQAHRVGGSAQSYLWDAVSAQPVAQATGASAGQIAFTSFEEPISGTWSYDPAHCVPGGRLGGRRAYRLASAVTYTVESTASTGYEVTVWVQGGLPALAVDGVAVSSSPVVLVSDAYGWQLLRWRVAAQAGQTLALRSANAGPVLLDEVRLCPVGAQLETQTYDALRGMTSRTDPSGRTIVYEYDALGRLQRVRDEQGRIITEQEYKYARQR